MFAPWRWLRAAFSVQDEPPLRFGVWVDPEEVPAVRRLLRGSVHRIGREVVGGYVRVELMTEIDAMGLRAMLDRARKGITK